LTRVFGSLAAVFLTVGGLGLAAAGVVALMESQSGRTARADGVILTGDYQRWSSSRRPAARGLATAGR
jgi:hypothetical protein